MTQHGRHVFEFGPFRIEDGERLLRRGGAVVPLPPKAVALLMALLHRSGEFIEKGQLLAEVWRKAASPRQCQYSARRSGRRRALLTSRRSRGAVTDSSRRSRLCAVGGTLPRHWPFCPWRTFQEIERRSSSLME